ESRVGRPAPSSASRHIWRPQMALGAVCSMASAGPALYLLDQPDWGGLFMSLKLRPGAATDADVCGRICYEAFKSVCTAHNFPPDFPSVEAGVWVTSMMLAHPAFYSVVAELDGRPVGSNFLDERACISGVGPISVDPTVQNRGIGGKLMKAVLDRA